MVHGLSHIKRQVKRGLLLNCSSRYRYCKNSLFKIFAFFLKSSLIVSAIYILEWWCVQLSTSRRKEKKAFLKTILKGLSHEMNLAFDDMYC